jgi:hypothetical protein
MGLTQRDLTVPASDPGPAELTARRADISGDITADHVALYRSWAERIGPAGDPQAAARKISNVLRTTPAHLLLTPPAPLTGKRTEINDLTWATIMS